MVVRLFILLCSLIITSSLSAQNFDNLEFGSSSSFDVVTWNIEWFPKNGQTTVDNVREIILALDADLIAVQEIDDVCLFDSVIDELPDYEWTYNQQWHEGLAYVYNTSSVSVTSSYTIFDTQMFWNVFPRAPLVLEIRYKGLPFILINNHLKCCGDAILEINNPDDEENRRYEALLLLEEYIGRNHADDRVILLGDFNDLLDDQMEHNVFNIFIEKPDDYQFMDMEIARGNFTNWSYPRWPSHLDHIMISDELFDFIKNPDIDIQTIKLDGYYNGGFSEYNFKVTDHRPVGLRISDLATSTEIVTSLELKVFPNPADDLLQFSSDATRNINYQLLDITGQLVKQGVVENSVSVSEIDEGLYIIRLDMEDQVFTSKISIIRK